MSLTVQEFNGQTIRIRKEDRYVCLTDMAKASGKQFKHWNELKSSSSYLLTLSSVVGIPTTDLVEINQGGIPENQGTWGHPKVALRFAQWCSDEFAVQVDCWIDELLTTGKVELSNENNQQIQLPPADIRVNNLVNSLQYLGIEVENPRFSQGLKDLTLNILGINQNALPPSEKWCGVTERAEELGYSPALVIKYRSQLGKYVKACGLVPKQEKRLVNGSEREVNLYLITDEFDKAVKEFMGAKTLAA
jgi:hypothetical protein